MEKKKIRIALILCALLFVAAVIGSQLFLRQSPDTWEQEGSSAVVLSEILPSNRTYPAPDGRLLDFVEVRNLSGNAVDISGYMLSDDLASIGYTFPDGTILPAHGYAVCWCDKDSESEKYAAFGISKDGGDTIYLYNNVNVLVDEKQVPDMAANTALIRTDANTWEIASQATPGYENTQQGYDRWLSSMGGDKTSVTITEVMTDNSCITAGNAPVPMDWIELTNTGSTKVTLEGAYLTNDPAEPLKWLVPTLELESGESTVISCAGSGDGSQMATFALSKTGCTVVLTGQWGNVLSSVTCPELPTDHAWAWMGDHYQTTDRATPGYENTEKGYESWVQSIGGQTLSVRITEVMTANRSTVLSKAGVLCDWVELENTGREPVVLDGAYLSDDPAQRGKWQIPSLTLQPGERAVICCAGADARESEATFGLSRSGAQVVLSGPKGNLLDTVSVPEVPEDSSWALQTDGTWLQTEQPTPGYENTQDGHFAYRRAQKPLGPLMISEVMPSNDQYLIQSDGKFYDWVEIANISDETVNLADFCISNDPENRTLFRFPKKYLQPGGRIAVICSGNADAVSNQIHVPFTISAQLEWLYLSDLEGNLSDYLRVSGVPAGGSMGRSADGTGWYYYDTPTPQRSNGQGAEQISAAPEIVTTGGFYEGKVTVELSGRGTIHYSLDGSIPTAEDPVYTAPLKLTETAVVRAISCEAGKLPSAAVSDSFFLGETHSLPVVSLSADPNALFGTDGICATGEPNRAIPCSIQFFESGGGFNLDCGLELLGTRPSPEEKKSFQVNFRGQYGAAALGYALFDEEEIQVMDSLSIQTNGDYSQSMIREELASRLSLQLSEDLPAQRDRWCVLYINGDYWGIYSLKETLNEVYYSQKEAVALSSVRRLEGESIRGTELFALAELCRTQDLTLAENYDQVASKVDIPTFIDWLIIQGYCSNGSTGRNIRWLISDETGKGWQIACYDLENTFYAHAPFESILSDTAFGQYADIARGLMRNEAFRTQFLTRLREAKDGVLSDSNVLALIDALHAQLEPEMRRERQRWGGYVESWEADIGRLRDYFTRYDHWGKIESNLRTFIGLTDEECSQYLGR